MVDGCRLSTAQVAAMMVAQQHQANHCPPISREGMILPRCEVWRSMLWAEPTAADQGRAARSTAGEEGQVRHVRRHD